MKALPILASFALVSTLTACTTIRSVEPVLVAPAPTTPISNSQIVNSGSIVDEPSSTPTVEKISIPPTSLSTTTNVS